MREFPAGPVEHPELDYGGAGFAATETRTPVVFLNAGRVSLLEATRDAGMRAVLVTDEVCVLTPALAAVWQEPDAAWVVRSAAGPRDGFTGRRLTSVGDVLTAAPAQAIDDVAVDFLRPSSADAVQVSAIVSVRHGAWEATQLGGPAAALAELGPGRHRGCGDRTNRWADSGTGGADRLREGAGARPAAAAGGCSTTGHHPAGHVDPVRAEEITEAPKSERGADEHRFVDEVDVEARSDAVPDGPGQA